MTIRTPRSIRAAAVLAERFAVLAGEIALIEAARGEAIAAANARADEQGAELLKERDAIAAKLEPWWAQAGAALTGGKRKSIELGGCVIGTRAGRDRLAIADEDAAVKALGKHDWAKPLLKVRTTLDKVAVLKSIDGVYKRQLAAAGLSRKPGGETFFVERAEQGGTMAATLGGTGAGR